MPPKRPPKRKRPAVNIRGTKVDVNVHGDHLNVIRRPTKITVQPLPTRPTIVYKKRRKSMKKKTP